MNTYCLPTATIEVVYPYQLKKKKKNVYMNLLEESIDILLDIPELRGTDVLIGKVFLCHCYL